MEAKKLTPDPTLPSEMSFPVDAQTEFCKLVSSATGFDFEAGRMDASTHPFSAGLWPGDTRFTTRFDEKDPFSCLYAVMHETGHALMSKGWTQTIHSLQEEMRYPLGFMSLKAGFGKIR